MPNHAAPQSLENGASCANRPSHVAAPRASNKHLDSSESFPSEHASIGSAVLVSFESECNGCDQLPQQVVIDENSQRAREENTINARFDVKTMSPTEVHRVGRFGCVNERPPPSSVPSTSNLTETYNRQTLPILHPHLRAFSDDELDVHKRSRPRFRATLQPPTSHRPTSSSGSFETLNWLNDVPSPAEPTLPIHPPLVRSPTPPGLPSFGTMEAVNYDLSTRPRRENRRGNSSPSDRQAATGTDGARGSRLDVIRRLLGIPSCSAPSPPSLPPGAIARAHDGTYVRGRFGNRQSGHGVGGGPRSRGLASHPFHNSPVADAPTAGTTNMERGPDGSNRPDRSTRAQWRPPPYASMLDVPVPNKKHSARRVRFADGPEGMVPSSATGAARSGPRTPASPPGPAIRPAPICQTDGYASPLSMQLDGSGQGDATNSQTAVDPRRRKRTSSNCIPWCCSVGDNNNAAGSPTSVHNDGATAAGFINSAQLLHSLTPSSRNLANLKLSLRERYTAFFSIPWFPAWGWQPCPGS